MILTIIPTAVLRRSLVSPSDSAGAASRAWEKVCEIHEIGVVKLTLFMLFRFQGSSCTFLYTIKTHLCVKAMLLTQTKEQKVLNNHVNLYSLTGNSIMSKPCSRVVITTTIIITVVLIMKHDTYLTTVMAIVKIITTIIMKLLPKATVIFIQTVTTTRLLTTVVKLISVSIATL